MSDEIFSFIKTNPIFQGEINELLKCGLCRNVMSNSHFMHCGCDFCHSCIVNYLQTTGNVCPSCGQDSGTSEITVNVSINKKIRALQVKCINKKCDHIDTVANMVQHVGNCNYRKMICTFSKFGCSEEVEGDEELVDHLNAAVVAHCNLLLQNNVEINNNINKLKEDVEDKNNSINGMKIEIEGLINENRILKDTNRQYERNLEEMEEKMSRIMINEEEMKIEFRETQEELSNKMTDQEMKLGEMEEKMESLKTHQEAATREMRQIKTELSNRVDGNSAELQNMKSEIAATSTKLNSSQTTLDNDMIVIERQISGEVDKMKEEVKKWEEKEDKMMKLENKLNIENQKLWQELGFLNYGEFLWKLDGISDKRKEASKGNEVKLDSRTFYSHRNGYKIKLLCCPDGEGAGKGSHLSLYFVIVQGEYDDILPWPCKRQIKLALVNQESLGEEQVMNSQVDKSVENCKDCFDKPTPENEGLGSPKFISWSRLEERPNLIKNDSLFIKCTTPL